MTSFLTDNDRWKAVVQRDRGADGAFLRAVLSTGVYCRPSCGARLPRRENVRFFDSSEAAERAGYRPCKRCHPNGQSIGARHAAAIAAACRFIESSNTAPSLEVLARRADMSRFHFHRIFKSIVGMTPKAYANRTRQAGGNNTATGA